MTINPAVEFDSGRSDLRPDCLTFAAVLYLALPTLVFVSTWLKFLPGTVLTVLLIGSMLSFRASWRSLLFRPRSYAVTVSLVIVSLIWCLYGGAGHFHYANIDWLVRDTVYADLILTSWPPAYAYQDGAALILRSAIGYFLPPALLVKALGPGAADIMLYTWTATGISIFLLLLPLPRKFGLALVAAILVVVFFSGMDYLGILLVNGHVPIFPLRLEWWVRFSYSSLSGQLFWGPNHALPIWLGTALFYRHWAHKSFAALAVLVGPLLLIWTPFAVLGLLPLLAFSMLRMKLGNDHWWRGIPILQWIAAGSITFVAIRFLTLSTGDIIATPSSSVATFYGSTVLEDYLYFVAMEFGLLALALIPLLRHSRGLFGLSVLMLATLPYYHFGPSNDTLLRVSTPYLVLLMILTIRALEDGFSGRIAAHRLMVVSVILLIGSATPIHEIARSAMWRAAPANYAKSLVEQQEGHYAAHYIGRLDRPDVEMLLRPPQIVPTGQARLAALERTLWHLPYEK